MIHLGCPVIDQHKLTRQLLDSLGETVVEPQNLHVVVIDNNSDAPYKRSEWENNGLDQHSKYRFDVSLVRNEKNRGYYWPLLQVAKFSTEADLIGLIHNDLVVYENGWDKRIRESFVEFSHLAMLGFCGSNEVDDRGGRGGGTMMNFAARVGQAQAGDRITQLHPALILDSMFMVLRRAVLHYLEIDDRIPLCHFLDKVWPLKLVEKGWRVGVLGIEIDHIGGQTAVGVQRYEEDAKQWCEENEIAHDGDGSLALYLESEKRFLTEFRQKHYVPSRLSGWQVIR